MANASSRPFLLAGTPWPKALAFGARSTMAPWAPLSSSRNSRWTVAMLRSPGLSQPCTDV